MKRVIMRMLVTALMVVTIASAKAASKQTNSELFIARLNAVPSYFGAVRFHYIGDNCLLDVIYVKHYDNESMMDLQLLKFSSPPALADLGAPYDFVWLRYPFMIPPRGTGLELARDNKASGEINKLNIQLSDTGEPTSANAKWVTKSDIGQQSTNISCAFKTVKRIN